MSLFTPKTTLNRCSFFEGYTDCHCHILPGVDDGFKTLEDSLAVLEKYENAGIRAVWLTPHVMEDFPNSPQSLGERFDVLRHSYSGPVELHLASENMLDALFHERLDEKNLLPLADRYLLVETSYFSAPMDLHKLLARIRSTGLDVILAHPERYRYMDMDEYSRLKDEGILFQLNLPSLTGVYGRTAYGKAEAMLKKGMYEFSGTDLHRTAVFEQLQIRELPRKLVSLVPRNQMV